MSRRPARAGFTLIEVLAAFAVLAVVAVAVLRGLVVARATADGASVRAEAARIAGELVEGHVLDALTGPGRLTGSSDGYDWQIVVGPLDPPLPTPEGEVPAFTPMRVEIAVRPGAGGPAVAPVVAKTVRLLRTAPR